MAREHQAGFTLIEVMLVLAIGSMLFVIAFVGQRGVRSRAQFDAAVNKVVAIIAETRNESTAGVNIVGGGDGTDKCPGGAAAGDPASERYQFAGIALTFDASMTPVPLKGDYYKTKPLQPGDTPGSNTCIFDTGTFSLPTALSVSVLAPASLAGQTGARVLYVRTLSAGLGVCVTPLTPADGELASFQTGSCQVPAVQVLEYPPVGQPISTVKLQLSDSEGHTSEVDIDASGLPKRAN